MATPDETAVCRVTEAEPWHGTAYGYSKKGCRGELCTAAKTAEQTKWKQNKQGKPIPDRVHGTTNGYGNYGCRCEECTGAWADAARNRYQPVAVDYKES